MTTPRQEDSAPPDRFCDVVMKGGVASGVVYPWAIAELAKSYRFQSIGGTSVGAIAAVATAAAEYQRRQSEDGSIAGFDRLARLPEELGGEAGDQSRLMSLFQPQAGGPQRLFMVLKKALNRGSTNTRIAGVAWGFLCAYWPALVVSIVVALFVAGILPLPTVLSAAGSFAILVGAICGLAAGGMIARNFNPAAGVLVGVLTAMLIGLTVWNIRLAALPGGDLGAGLRLLLALPLAVLMTIVSIAAWAYRDLTVGIVENGFGLCNGMNAPNTGTEAFTPWLHRLIQEAAGRTIDDKPLTFGDLWGARGFPPDWLNYKEGETDDLHSIELRMFSTNLTHGRPYIFPLEEEKQPANLHQDQRLFFRPEDMHRVLPPQVAHWLVDRGNDIQEDERYGAAGISAKLVRDARDLGLKELPPARDFPVLLAARLSMSFPLLFSAVPLWAIDYGMEHNGAGAGNDSEKFRKCWFSDGGISSNFPIHMFDSLLPKWPTFGITLQPHPSKTVPEAEAVFLPQDYSEGYGERWAGFDENARTAARLGGFLSAIASTMQNWNDNTLARMPGVRDRVARVRLAADEGGLNLNMDLGKIRRIAERGQHAARELQQRFSGPPGAHLIGKGWDEHRQVRYNVMLKMVEAHADSLVRATGSENPYATDLKNLIKSVDGYHPVGFGSGHPDTKEVKGYVYALEQLQEIMEALAAFEGTDSFAAVPKPELRVRPPL